MGVAWSTGMSELQSAIAASLTDTLLHLSSRAPLALLLDDVDALDNESLGLLAALCEPLRRQPFMLVLSAQTGHPAQASQARVRLAADAQIISRQELSEAELAELVSGVFGSVPHCAYVSRCLYTRTAGNPAHAFGSVAGARDERRDSLCARNVRATA
jgi:predicted ATPase